MARTSPRDGLTLIELLIVVAMILLLIQLALPAVESARERARVARCQNQLRQLGYAALLHENAFGRFPSSGWRDPWMADPDKGNDAMQPGGWTYNILPYIERTDLHDLGKGLVGAKRAAALDQLMQTPVSLFYCPSRRRASLYPGFAEDTINYAIPEKVAKTDYAANAGDFLSGLWPDGTENPKPPEPGAWIPIVNYTGVIHHRSEVTTAQIPDGLSKTYLVGEKLLDSRSYKNGRDGGDDQILYVGADFDNCRWTRKLPSMEPLGPRRDDDYGGDPAQFGSAHPSGCNLAYCDGAVRTISFDIDPDVHRWNGNRKDSTGKFHYVKVSSAAYRFDPIQ